MREIKFRAWDGKEMHNEVQPYLWGDKPCVMSPVAGITFYEPIGTRRYWYEINVEAVMQWTGLIDKNGKDIYIGDVIEFDNGDRATLATEDWLEVYCDWIGDPDCSDQVRDLYRICKGAVIGNRYQNKELTNS